MIRLPLLAALLLSLAPMASAQDMPVLAEYWTNSGSLPPEYAWETEVTILTDGGLTLKYCTGYETQGPACKTRRAKVAPEALEAIRAAAAESGLSDKPAREAEAPMVGGSMTGGVVWLEGAKVVLLSDPHPDDAARIAPVLAAIEAAIPARFHRFLKD